MVTFSIEHAMILKTAIDRLSCFKGQMRIEFGAFDAVCLSDACATHSLTRPGKRLALYPQGAGRIRKAAEAVTTPLSLRLAYPGRQYRRFAPTTCLDAPLSASNYGF